MSIKIPIVSSFDNAGISSAKKSFGQLQTAGDKAQFAIRKAAVPATLALGALAAGAGKAIAAGEAVGTANARIEQINKSMGLFGGETDKVSQRLVKLAETTAMNTGMDNLSIKATQAKLLTFSNLAKTADQAGGAFDRANKAALDMAAAGFGTAEGNAVQLGKALNDPIKGIAALAKSGVTFTEQEKDKIKVLVESNKMLEAQEMVLAAIEKQVGGTAEATANDTDKMREGFAQFTQSLGLALLPVLEVVTPILLTMASWAKDNPGAFMAVAAAIGAVAAAIVAINIAMALNPFGIIAIGIAALVTGIVVAYTQFETFRKVVRSVVNGVITYFETVANAWVTVINTLIKGYNLIPGLPDISLVGNVSLGRMRSGGMSGTEGLSDSRITALADGGIVLGPQIALIGEAGPEAVIPLDRLGDMGMGGGMNITVNAGLVSTPDQIGQEIIQAIQKAQRRSGPVFAPA
jgi:hypothetical protein